MKESSNVLSNWLVLLGGKLKTKQTRNNTSLMCCESARYLG